MKDKKLNPGDFLPDRSVCRLTAYLLDGEIVEPHDATDFLMEHGFTQNEARAYLRSLK